MLLIIHNLPSKIKYQEVKSLIQSKCGLSDVILDNLIAEGRSKRVTVGLADDGDAAILARKINGLFLEGQQLYVEDVRQAKASEQPYRASESFSNESRQQDYQSFNQVMVPSSNFQGDFPNNLGFQNASNNYQCQQQIPPETAMINYNMHMSKMFYMPVPPPASNNYLGFGGQGQQVPPLFPAFSETSHQRPSQQEQSFNMQQDNMSEMRQINSNNIWGQNEGRLDDNSFGERRLNPSATRGRSSSGANRSTQPGKRVSRWENNDFQMPRQRSRSPPRGNWNSRRRDESERFQERFGNQHVVQGDMHQQGFNQPQPVLFQNYPARSDNFVGQVELPPSNDSWMNQTWRDRDSRSNRDNRNEAHFFKSPKSRPNTRNDKSVRNDNHVPRRSEEIISRRDGFHDSPSKPSQSKNWRDEPQVPPKRFRSRWENDEPPPKRQAKPKDRASPRSDNWREKPPAPQQNPNNIHKDDSTATIKITKPIDDVTALNKDNTWRDQATSTIAKRMLKNLRIDAKPKDGILHNLKRSIRARINLMYQDKLSSSMEDIIEKYRHKFPTSQDQAHFVTVLESINDKKNERISRDKDGLQSENGKEKRAPSSEVIEENAAKVSAGKEPASGPKEGKQEKSDVNPSNSGENSGYLPKFVKDKKTNKQEKMKHRQEFTEEVYSLPEMLQKHLDHEADILCDLFMGECINPDDDKEKIICETITDAAADDFRKVIRVQVMKRLLKINTNLPIRIFSYGGKRPPRMELDTFLKQYGVISVRRSDRSKSNMLIACVDTFENYDKLLSLGSANVGDCSLSFKPIHISGPPKKVTRAQIMEAREKFIQSQIDKSDEDLLKPAKAVENNEIEQDNDVEIVNDEQIKIDIASDNEEVVEDATSKDQLYDPEEPNEPDDDDDIPDDIDEEDLEDY